MDLMQQVYLGNSIEKWLTALGILLIVFAILMIVKSLVIRKLSKLAKLTETKFDDLVVEVLKQTKIIILIIASAYAASHSLNIKPSIMDLSQKAVVLILLLQGGLWVSAGISFSIRETVQKRTGEDASSTTTITFLGFVARFVLWIIVLLLILDNLGVNITGLVAGLGIGGIAIALAVQNILGDLLASLSIVLDKPFVIGDSISVDSLSGTIEHIGIKTTRIRSIDGEQLIFSNNDLLKSRIRNFKRMSERRIVFGFGVVYQTPLEKLRAIKEIVGDIIKKEKNTRLERVHFKEYGDSALKFEVVYFITNPDYNVYMNVQESINLEIFRRFQQDGIEFAYPTRTLFIQKETT